MSAKPRQMWWLLDNGGRIEVAGDYATKRVLLETLAGPGEGASVQLTPSEAKQLIGALVCAVQDVEGHHNRVGPIPKAFTL